MLHLHNSNWTRKLISNQLHHIFYITPHQPEIKSKFSKSSNNIATPRFQEFVVHQQYIICATLHLHNLNRYRQTYSTLHSFNLIFLRFQKIIPEFYTWTTWNLCEDIILHYTQTQHDFCYISTIWFQDSTPVQPDLSTMRFCTLHSHNLTLTTFIQLDFSVLHLHNMKSLSLWQNDIFHATLAHSNFHYIRNKIVISVTFSFLLCVCVCVCMYVCVRVCVLPSIVKANPDWTER